MSTKASHSKISKHKPVKVKLEKGDSKQIEECSEEKDLSFYVKDRVGLMRQVFAILKDRELTAMAPDCFRGLKADKLQEALLDEVLGISTKRLLSIIDGYECPSDTDSSEESSAEAMETISLDSISSDEDEILSRQDNRPKKKHMKKKSKSEKDVKKKNKNKEETGLVHAKNKKNKKETQTNDDNQNADGTGMTVLELLELQARARAIKAQLAAVEFKDSNNEEADKNSSCNSSESDDEVVIKEEPTEIVEIHSSSDENESKKDSNKKSKKQNNGNNKKLDAVQNQDVNLNDNPTNTSTSSKPTKLDQNAKVQQPPKVKLNRFNPLKTSSNNHINNNIQNNASAPVSIDSNPDQSNPQQSEQNSRTPNEDKIFLDKIKDSHNKNVNDKMLSIADKKESDEDEITLELSDSEKMDLLEGFNSPTSFTANKKKELEQDNVPNNKKVNESHKIRKDDVLSDSGSSKSNSGKKKKSKKDKKKHKVKHRSKNEENQNSEDTKESAFKVICDKSDVSENSTKDDNSVENTASKSNDVEENKSEGECSSEVESENDVLCLSDEDASEVYQNSKKRQYRKKKKDKISEPEIVPETIPSNKVEDNFSKEEEKEVTSQDLSEKAPEDEIQSQQTEESNIVTQEENKNTTEEEQSVENTELKDTQKIVDVNEKIFEISDESDDDVSSVLPKEPTIQEIKEFSEKIDYEIERENLDILGDSANIDLKIKDNEQDESNESIEETSWKTRWLKSSKVQRVLATSNLCNALRKKNKELKKKLENNVAKISTEQEKDTAKDPVTAEVNLEVIEGSVSEYKKLPNSTKYVAPVEEPKVDEKTMANDAKQLMKMYKKLLKMHDLDENDEERKKAKKLKKEKKKEKKEKKKNKKEKKEEENSKVSNTEKTNDIIDDQKPIENVE